jgi:hypothetical protein
MKTYISIAIAMMVLFAFGQAYAVDDQMPVLVAPGSAIEQNATSNTDWSAPIPAGGDPRLALADDDIIPALTARNDIGFSIYTEAVGEHDTFFTLKGARGSAAGGMTKKDETARIWDNLLGVPGGSDLP